MSIIKKPSIKSGTDTVLKAVSVGVGVKMADGVSAIMPSSTNSYKNYILAALGLLGAASVDTKKPMGENVQLALLGFGGKPIYDEITARTKEAIAPQDPNTIAGKFFNAFLGHKDEPVELAERLAAVDWMPNNDAASVWDRVETQDVAWTGA
ncbi:hypothetical protein [Flavobacterium capsici]|uniref:Uncharacterized protein n=1 Tax=Flavobacterium capsici TaxID=3075618 RepID=A0AA96EYM2_9FLAO|nr:MULTISPECIES: hypothetical protein [unclassified Flavobacterium]WNM19272.1 hypothetical protein RN608_00985 [Flavobacterium sp. PMR2A8]WNM20661.1 hypothetical protein RN605_08155 [Flavobacterium sp. PMTSA4]